MLVEQAIFTSVRSGRNEGYQLAASSPGIRDTDARELAQWGPGHDSLYDALPGSDCISFHRMQSGSYCISRTVLAGHEYSGRGGQRVYTHMFLVPPDALRRFANQPFRVMEALVLAGRTTVLTTTPRQLEPVPLIGRATAMKTASVDRLLRILGPEKLATLVSAALKEPSLGVTTPTLPGPLLSGLLDLLPIQLRVAFSFTTGLVVSPRRPYRLAILPADREEQRKAVRHVHAALLDLTSDPPTRFAPRRGWPVLVYERLRSGQLKAIETMVEAASASSETDPDLLAEQMQTRFAEKSDLPELLKPFSA